MFRKSVLTAALIATTTVSVFGASTAMAMPVASSIGRLAEISVTDRNSGQVLPVYRFRGEYWVAGTPGSKYSVAVRNNMGERVMAVLSVDGVNVLNGETASTDQAGYVFSGYQNYEVTGWRKSDSEVAAFQFVASPRSYAERTGRPANVGVIGVALFRERYQPPAIVPYGGNGGYGNYGNGQPDYRNDDYRFKRGEAEGRSSAPPAAASAPSSDGSLKRRAYESDSARVEPKLGTGHGAREYSEVARTEFERAQSTPNETIRIRYDSRENLIAMGVIQEPVYRHHNWRGSPDPFPERGGFVPDPPRW
jgi:hypothetical protein